MSLPTTLAAVRCVTALRGLEQAQQRLADAFENAANSQDVLNRLAGKQRR